MTKESKRPELSVEAAIEIVIDELGGTHREGQVQMSEAIVNAIDTNKHLLVQAGTGTGKSLAYIIPAALHAQYGVGENGAGRTLIATATLALQRQLIEQDLPLAVHALGKHLTHTPTYAVLKGRHNYVCLDRFNRAPADVEDDPDALISAPTSHLGRQAKKFRAWVDKTETGDRDDFDGELDGRIWRANSVSGRECVGASKCLYGQDCFAEKARVEALASDIVVTNHALLSIDLLEAMHILPDHDVVVIDEAHELVDRATGALAGSLDERSIDRAAGLAKKFLDDVTVDRLFEAAGALGVALEQVPMQGTTQRLTSIDGSLLLALTMLRDVCRVMVTDLNTSSNEDPEMMATRQRAKVAIKEIFDTAAEVLALDEETVVWVDVSRTPVLHHAPLSVAQVMHDKLFAERTVVLTSATLQVAGTMEATAKNLGLFEKDDWTSLDVGSPFDYAKQGILYCAAHLPNPGRDGIDELALDELGDLIDAADGRTLALFSSWRGVERAAEYLEARFKGVENRDLLVAKRGEPVSELVKQFRDDHHSTLLGTVSLWQGIDVPGQSCSLVVIDRIPFPRPDEPIMAARSARVDEDGGSGFRSVSLPRAALLLAQGVGRLIRSETDRGVVAVLDARLATSGYGATLRKSVPPLWWTTDPQQVKLALSRIDKRE